MSQTFVYIPNLGGNNTHDTGTSKCRAAAIHILLRRGLEIMFVLDTPWEVSHVLSIHSIFPDFRLRIRLNLVQSHYKLCCSISGLLQ